MQESVAESATPLQAEQQETPIEDLALERQRIVNDVMRRAKEGEPEALKLLKIRENFRTGRLSYAQFQLLSKERKAAYKAKFGRPRSEEEQRGIARTVAKRRAAKKRASRARVKTRR